MQEVSRGNRLHIGIFGGCNSGKSSLINSLCGQSVALVDDVAGTTTDPVYKAMEVRGVGAVTFIDTAGYDDTTELGAKRIKATDKVIAKCDIAILVLRGQERAIDIDYNNKIKAAEVELIVVENYSQTTSGVNSDIAVNAKSGEGIESLLKLIATRADKMASADDSMLKDSVSSGEIVVLVMPQDEAAPKGRLILPQVQAIRELLDKHCIAIAVTMEGYINALAALKQPPKLVICDSQVFLEVEQLTPSGVDITSFSMLLARQKGDIDILVRGAHAMDNLNSSSRVLIAEACTHAPVGEDIGRVKLPAMLLKKYGVTNVTIVAGESFPTSLKDYDLVIHCGACMFNRHHVMSRINMAIADGCPITNYGVAIAKLKGILHKCKV